MLCTIVRTLSNLIKQLSSQRIITCGHKETSNPSLILLTFNYTGVKELHFQWFGLLQVAGRLHPSSAIDIVASNLLTYKLDTSFADFTYAIISRSLSCCETYCPVRFFARSCISR
jgi:hypothetical protein